MQTPARRRQLKGLAFHRARHPSNLSRRLVKRTSSWKVRIRRGVCRWCGDLAPTPDLTWHPYCLTAYLVASGQRPDRMASSECEMCGGQSSEIDHRLSISVAAALGPAALIRAYTPENLRWLCHECHRRKSRQDRALVRFLRGCALDWRGARSLMALHSQWIESFLLPSSLGPAGR